MEEGQRHNRMTAAQLMRSEVLILVVMEEGQRHQAVVVLSERRGCLNPCCNGRGSKTLRSKLFLWDSRPTVLILVVMEEGQRHRLYRLI